MVVWFDLNGGSLNWHKRLAFFFCLDWNSHRLERQLKGICQKHLKANVLATAARGKGNSWHTIHIPKSLGGKDGE